MYSSLLLQEFEKTCIAEKKFKDAELAANRMKELREQEIEYQEISLQEKAGSEVSHI